MSIDYIVYIGTYVKCKRIYNETISSVPYQCSTCLKPSHETFCGKCGTRSDTKIISIKETN